MVMTLKSVDTEAVDIYKCQCKPRGFMTSWPKTPLKGESRSEYDEPRHRQVNQRRHSGAATAVKVAFSPESFSFLKKA